MPPSRSLSLFLSLSRSLARARTLQRPLFRAPSHMPTALTPASISLLSRQLSGIDSHELNNAARIPAAATPARGRVSMGVSVSQRASYTRTRLSVLPTCSPSPYGRLRLLSGRTLERRPSAGISTTRTNDIHHKPAVVRHTILSAETAGNEDHPADSLRRAEATSVKRCGIGKRGLASPLLRRSTEDPIVAQSKTLPPIDICTSALILKTSIGDYDIRGIDRPGEC
jgi:hypothetical protein